MPVRIEGYVDNGRGAPAAGIPAVATRLSDGVVVDTTVTDADGYWLFTGLAPADEHLVTLTDTAGNAVARAPWSGELREAYVRDRLEVAGKPVVLDPAAGNSLLWGSVGLYAPTGITLAAADLRYEPLDSAYTKAEADARYPQKTDIDPYPTYLTSTEGNATYLPLTGGALSGPLTIQSKAVGVSATGGNTLAWNADGFYVAAGAVTDIWVDVLGDTMTGVLNMAANVLPTTTNTRDLGSTTLRWRKVWATDIDATNAPTVGGSALLTTAAGDLRYEPIDTMYTKAEDDARFVQLTGGSVMTGLLGPTTTNTRDLGTTALRWRKLWAVDGEFTNAPTVSGVAVLTATSAGLLYEPLDSAYTKAEDDARFVQLTGGSVMTGLLGPTTHNTRDLGTTSLRWRKLWGVDADLSGLLSVAGASVTLTAASVSVEVGASGTTNTPLIDFHSSATATDYDSRISASGGTAVSGKGTLQLEATPVNISGTFWINSRPVIMAGCSVYHNVDQNVASATLVTIAFNSERFDTDAFHDTVTNNSRLTVPTGLGGTYLVWAMLQYDNINDATYRQIRIRVNGATYIASNTIAAIVGVHTDMCVSATAVLAAGDYVELIAAQGSASTRLAVFQANDSPAFGMQRVG
jgi:hypothetical protein